MVADRDDAQKRDPEQGLYIISVAAGLAEVHPQTLRMYERRGLLRPLRTPKNRRRYSDSDIMRLRHIQELTQREGLNLSGVRKVLEMEDEVESLRAKVEQLQDDVAEMQIRMLEDMRDLKRSVALSRKQPMTIAIRKRKASQ